MKILKLGIVLIFACPVREVEALSLQEFKDSHIKPYLQAKNQLIDAFTKLGHKDQRRANKMLVCMTGKTIDELKKEEKKSAEKASKCRGVSHRRAPHRREHRAVEPKKAKRLLEKKATARKTALAKKTSKARKQSKLQRTKQVSALKQAHGTTKQLSKQLKIAQTARDAAERDAAIKAAQVLTVQQAAQVESARKAQQLQQALEEAAVQSALRESLLDQIDKVDQMLLQAGIELSLADQAKAALENDLRALENAMTVAQEQLKAGQEADLTNVRDQLTQAQAHAALYERQYQEALNDRAQLIAMLEKTDVGEGEKAQLIKRVHDLEAQLAQAHHELENFQNRLNGNEAAYLQLTRGIDKARGLNAEVKSHTHQVNKLAGHIENLKAVTDLDSLEASFPELTEDIKMLQKNIADTGNALAEAQIPADSKTDLIAGLQATLNKLNGINFDAVRARINELKKREEQAPQKVEDVQKLVATLEEQLPTLQSDNEELEKAINNLNEETSQGTAQGIEAALQEVTKARSNVVNHLEGVKKLQEFQTLVQIEPTTSVIVSVNGLGKKIADSLADADTLERAARDRIEDLRLEEEIKARTEQ
jgi:predicted  nucleic acid-binding Zn-ribbon protein